MSGKEEGVIQFLKQDMPLLIWSICMSHTLNLCISSAVDSPRMQTCIPLITKSYLIFPVAKASQGSLKCHLKPRCASEKINRPFSDPTNSKIEGYAQIKGSVSSSNWGSSNNTWMTKLGLIKDSRETFEAPLHRRLYSLLDLHWVFHVKSPGHRIEISKDWCIYRKSVQMPFRKISIFSKNWLW